MANDPHNQAGGSEGGSGMPQFPNTAYFAKHPMPEVPQSKPLQWFLLLAFVVTGASYVVGLWTEDKAEMVKTATSRIRQATHRQSDFSQHMAAGEKLFASNQFDKAEREFRLALLRQESAEAHQRLGAIYIKQGNAEAGFAEYREAIKADPTNNAPATSALALAMLAQGKTDDAERIIRSSLAQNPNSGSLHYDLAATLLQTRVETEGRHRAAVDSGNAKEAADAESRSRSLAADALKEFAEAEKNQFDSAEFWTRYGALLNESHRFAEAETRLRKAVSEDPKSGSAHFELGAAGLQLGHYAEAIEHFNTALTITPDDPNTLIEMALLYATATNSEVRSPKMAVQLATRATDATTSQNIHYMDTLARCYAADGDFFGAIAWENKAIHRATQLNEMSQLHDLQGRLAQFMEHHTN